MAAESHSSLTTSLPPAGLVFLSYARADRARVEPIAAALRARGASVWYDGSVASGGPAYVDSLMHALRRTDLMLVFVSAASSKSAWVAEEVRSYRSLMAREPGHQLLAVHLDKTRAPSALTGADSVDAREDNPNETARLIATATGATAAASISTPTPPAAEEPTHAETPSPAAAGAPISSGPIFVSYARFDRAQVEPVIAELRTRGASVWDDGGLSHGGGPAVGQARDGLEQSQTLLVVVSAASAGSAWVEDEVRAFQSLKARDTARRIVVLHLDTTPVPVGLMGADAVDAQSLAPAVAAGLIAAALPAAVVAMPVASEPAAGAEVSINGAHEALEAPVEVAPEAAASNGATPPAVEPSAPEPAMETAPAVETAPEEVTPAVAEATAQPGPAVGEAAQAEAVTPVQEEAAPAPVAPAEAPAAASVEPAEVASMPVAMQAAAPAAELAPTQPRLPEIEEPMAVTTPRLPPLAQLEKTAPIRTPKADIEAPAVATGSGQIKRNAGLEIAGLLVVLVIAIAIAAGMYALLGAH